MTNAPERCARNQAPTALLVGALSCPQEQPAFSPDDTNIKCPRGTESVTATRRAPLPRPDWIRHVTTRASAEKAALTFRETQPAIDALKETMARNTAAKKILGAYMVEKHVASFRGITLRCVPFEGWDSDKLRAYLGDKAKDFRKTVDRKYFGLTKRRAVIK